MAFVRHFETPVRVRDKTLFVFIHSVGPKVLLILSEEIITSSESKVKSNSNVNIPPNNYNISEEEIIIFVRLSLLFSMSRSLRWQCWQCWAQVCESRSEGISNVVQYTLNWRNEK